MSVHALSDRLPRKKARGPAPPRRGARKTAAVAITRASLVADFVAICELDPAVEALRAPSEPALFEVDGEIIAHTADFEVVRDGQVFLVDVAADADLMNHPLRVVLVGGGMMAEDGRPFSIETAASLHVEPRFTTVRLIMACRRTPVSAGDRVRILHHLDESGVAPLIECAGAVQNTRDGVAAVLALAVEGLVAVDIDRPILPETPVRRRKLSFPDD